MKIIIQQPWGGLGDNLQFSTIPEVAYKQFGEKCVYISNKNAYRNEEIKKLVWDLNPYIAGFTDEENQNSLSIPNRDEDKKLFWTQKIELLYNLNPTNKHPKIYYTFDESKKDIFQNKIFLDLSSSSENALLKEPTVINNILKFLTFLKNKKVPINIVRFEKLQNNKNDFVNYIDFFENVSEYYVNDIFDYCNLIKYCNTFVSFSGGQTLASAIKGENIFPNIVAFHRKSALFSRLYIHNNVQYIV